MVDYVSTVDKDGNMKNSPYQNFDLLEADIIANDEGQLIQSYQVLNNMEDMDIIKISNELFHDC